MKKIALFSLITSVFVLFHAHAIVDPRRDDILKKQEEARSAQDSQAKINAEKAALERQKTAQKIAEEQKARDEAYQKLIGQMTACQLNGPGCPPNATGNIEEQLLFDL